LQQPVGSRSRIAYHSITPAKHHELSTELRRSEQVPELTMTANHHRDPSQYRGRDHCQIAIEVEGMSHLNVQRLQTAHQAPPAPDRLHAVEASAEPKLMQLAETFQKRAFPLYTAKMYWKVICP
jgi:hypothetical protein